MGVFRHATANDAEILAAMNNRLIRDEGHRNKMTPSELTERMHLFLTTDYEAVIFELEAVPVGYALFRTDPDWIYIRQFYVESDLRRQGIGRAAIEWLQTNCWTGGERIRIEVLVGNRDGIGFWRAVGFADYCLTMECELPSKPTGLNPSAE